MDKWTFVFLQRVIFWNNCSSILAGELPAAALNHQPMVIGFFAIPYPGLQSTCHVRSCHVAKKYILMLLKEFIKVGCKIAYEVSSQEISL